MNDVLALMNYWTVHYGNGGYGLFRDLKSAVEEQQYVEYVMGITAHVKDLENSIDGWINNPNQGA